MYTEKFGAELTILFHFLELLNSVGPEHGLPMAVVPVSRTGVKGIEQVLECIKLAPATTAKVENGSRYLT